MTSPLSRRRPMAGVEWSAAALAPRPGSFLAVLVDAARTPPGPEYDFAVEVVHIATTDAALREATRSPDALREHLRVVVPGARPEALAALDTLARRWRGAAS